MFDLVDCRKECFGAVNFRHQQIQIKLELKAGMDGANQIKLFILGWVAATFILPSLIEARQSLAPERVKNDAEFFTRHFLSLVK